MTKCYWNLIKYIRVQSMCKFEDDWRIFSSSYGQEVMFFWITAILQFDGGHISFIGLKDNYDIGWLEIDQVY